jgi:flagellin-like hook-associated protein FlgL
MTAFSVNSLSGQLVALRALRHLDRGIAISETRLATGLRINGPADDGAVFALAEGLRINQAANLGLRKNLAQARGIAGVALAGATAIRETLAELRQITVSAEGSTADQLREKAARFTEGLSEIQSFIGSSAYVGMNLLDGTRQTLNFLAGQQGGTVPLHGADFQSGILDDLRTNSLERTLSPDEPPPPSDTTSLQVRFISESAGYRNVFGYYNSKTGAAGILFPDVEADGANAPLTPGVSTATFSVKTADLEDIHYFLIANGANLNPASAFQGQLQVMRAPDGQYSIARLDSFGAPLRDANGNIDFLDGAGAAAFFTERSKNAGRVDYASGAPGPHQTRRTLRADTRDGPTGIVGFEDILAIRHGNNGSYGQPGDGDYDDAVFDVQILPPGSGGGGGGPPGTGLLTIREVLAAVDAAISRADAMVGRLASDAKAVERADHWLIELNDALEMSLGALVDAGLGRESAQLAALRTQRELAAHTLGVIRTGSRQALLALFSSARDSLGGAATVAR